MAHHMHWSRLWPDGGVLLAVVLLAGCGQTFTSPSAPIHSSTPAPTYTAAPAQPLRWQAHSLPAPMSDPKPGLSLANTGTAWICAPHGASAEVWVTRDGAQHWQRVSDVTASGRVDSCSVVSDQIDPSTAVVQMAQQQPGCCALPAIPYALKGTRDGGQTWAGMNGPLSEISSLATYHGVSYAIFHGPFADASPGIFAFAASSDSLHTWRRLDDLLANQGADPADARAVRDIWVNPATGEILVHTQTSVIWSDRFLVSDNGGATWRDLHAPEADQFLVRAPFAAGLWELCGLRTSSSSMHPDWPMPLVCTLDGGKTWTDRDGVGEYDNEAFALANDGDVLAGDTVGMYRSSPGKSAWEPLGAPPTSTNYYWYEYQPGAGSALSGRCQRHQPPTRGQRHRSTSRAMRDLHMRLGTHGTFAPS
jgi:hypothetical protein